MTALKPLARKCARFLIPAIVVGATIAAFYPSLWNGFVEYDDDALFLNNQSYRGLGWPQLRWMFTTFLNGHYQPLSWITLGLDYVIWGMNPFGYHLTSLLLHAANALVFYFVTVRLLSLAFSLSADDFSLRWGAALAALLFAIHPLRVESVVWATERRDVLSGLFFVLAILFYLRAVTAETKANYHKWFVLTLAVYVFSLLSKAVGISLPVVLVVLDVYPLRRLGWGDGRWFGAAARRVWLEKLPFVLLAAGAAWVAISAQYQSGTVESFAHRGVFPRLGQGLYGLTFYAWKTLVPTQLSPLYEMPASFNPWSRYYTLGGLVVVAATLILLNVRARFPAGLAVWLYYVALIAPVSGIAQSGPQLVADRYSYLACLGWVILAGGGFTHLWNYLSGMSRWFPVLAAAMVTAVLLWLGNVTRQQIYVWHDTRTLWNHVLGIPPESSIAHNDLGNLFFKEGKFDEAIKHYRRALELNRTYPMAHFNLGNALSRIGKIEEATEQYRRAIQLTPNFSTAQYNFGRALAALGRYEEAMEHFRHAVELNPDFAEAHNNLGLLLAGSGKREEAIEHYRRALQAEPKLAVAHINLAAALSAQGKAEEAITHYQRSLELEPKRASAHVDLGEILAARGRLDEAMSHFRRALEIEPNLATAHFGLGRALSQKDRLDEAIAHYKLAIKNDPKMAVAHYNLGNAYFKRGERVQDMIWFGDAIDQYELAVKLQPDYALAYYNMGNALLKVGDSYRAIQNYQLAQKHGFTGVEFYTNYGSALEGEGLKDHAVNQFRRALEINPRYGPAHYNWGNLLLKEGKLKEAIEHYRRALEYNPKYVEAITNMGSAFETAGDKEEALKQYNAALKINPRFAPAHFNLAMLLAQRGETDAAISHFRNVVQINAWDVEARVYLGRLLARTGQVDEAAAEFKTVLKRYPGFSAAKQGLEQIQAQLNKQNEANPAQTETPTGSETNGPH
jgi:tetratricopeptide (TPR) repeat protein